MSEVDKVNEKTIKDGGVLALLYFDIHAKSKESVQQIGVGFVQKITREEGIVYARGEIDEPLEEEGRFSTSVEVRVLTKSFSSLCLLCATYSPFYIEILEPTEIKLSLDRAHDVLMLFSTITHQYKKFILERTSTKEEVELYKKNLENKAALGKKLLEKKRVG
ncbi:MAG: hypothetical protein WC501_05550 [Candidatus Micrarchaeia archaeon]|jgi:hypothetical protein